MMRTFEGPQFIPPEVEQATDHEPQTTEGDIHDAHEKLRSLHDYLATPEEQRRERISVSDAVNDAYRKLVTASRKRNHTDKRLSEALKYLRNFAVLRQEDADEQETLGALTTAITALETTMVPEGEKRRAA